MLPDAQPDGAAGCRRAHRAGMGRTRQLVITIRPCSVRATAKTVQPALEDEDPPLADLLGVVAEPQAHGRQRQLHEKQNAIDRQRSLPSVVMQSNQASTTSRAAVPAATADRYRDGATRSTPSRAARRPARRRSRPRRGRVRDSWRTATTRRRTRSTAPSPPRTAANVGPTHRIRRDSSTRTVFSGSSAGATRSSSLRTRCSGLRSGSMSAPLAARRRICTDLVTSRGPTRDGGSWW